MVTASSSNPSLVPNANLLLGGSGAARTITAVPVWGGTGTATITVTVSDGAAQSSDNLVLTVSTTSGYAEVNKATIVPDASTSYTGWVPQNAINGSTADPGWHNIDNRPPGTDWLRVDLQATVPVGRVQYCSRQYAFNGTFLEYAIYVTSNPSTDMAAWGPPVCTGTWSWPNGAEVKTLDFTAKWGRYVIFRCLRGAYADRWASAGEVWVYTTQAGPGPDSDADGLPDAWELAFFGNLSQTASGDADGDGLSNTFELQLSTNPTSVDTDNDGVRDGDGDCDGDGLSDGAEVVVSGTSPFDADSDNDGIIDSLEPGLDWLSPTKDPEHPEVVTVATGLEHGVAQQTVRRFLIHKGVDAVWLKAIAQTGEEPDFFYYYQGNGRQWGRI